MNKRVSLLYFSATDGTAKIVKEIAHGMGEIANEYNLTLLDNRQKELVFDQNDLVIIGVPVYVGRVPDFLMDYFSKVKGNSTQAVLIVVYGNRDYDDALLELKDHFEDNGFIGVAAGAFIGEHSKTTRVATGRPDDVDLKAAKEFGVKIKEKITARHSFKTGELRVKGKFPYRDRTSAPPTVPETTDQCTQCGICAKHCPMGAIAFDDFKKIDSSKCISCCSCIKRCPVNAKAIHDERFKTFNQWLIENYGTVYQEPELFI